MSTSAISYKAPPRSNQQFGQDPIHIKELRSRLENRYAHDIAILDRIGSQDRGTTIEQLQLIHSSVMKDEEARKQLDKHIRPSPLNSYDDDEGEDEDDSSSEGEWVFDQDGDVIMCAGEELDDEDDDGTEDNASEGTASSNSSDSSVSAPSEDAPAKARTNTKPNRRVTRKSAKPTANSTRLNRPAAPPPRSKTSPKSETGKRGPGRPPALTTSPNSNKNATKGKRKKPTPGAKATIKKPPAKNPPAPQKEVTGRYSLRSGGEQTKKVV